MDRIESISLLQVTLIDLIFFEVFGQALIFDDVLEELILGQYIFVGDHQVADYCMEQEGDFHVLEGKVDSFFIVLILAAADRVRVYDV